MSSGMKLRSHIRAPHRYGEDDTEETLTAGVLQSMREARGQSVYESGRVVGFNSELPAAAFPTLGQPRWECEVNGIGQQNGLVKGYSGAIYGQNAQGAVQFDPKANQNGDGGPERVIFDHVPLEEIENYAASNGRGNPVYMRNLEIMSGANADVDRNLEMEDSDDEEMIDASEALAAKIHNPTWSDLCLAIQVEIIDNMLKTSCWRSVCHKLDLGPDDRAKFAAYLDARNKQIAQENKQLRKMRRKQLRTLLRIDNSSLKTNSVPPQLVLRKRFRKTTRALCESLDQGLLMCQAADVLAARQFLHHHGLPRNYAGDWGHSLIALQEPEDDGLEEKFEWKEDLTLSSEESDASANDVEESGLEDDATTCTRKHFIKSVGEGSTINPKDLIRHSDNEQPLVDWGRYFPYWHPDTTSMPSHRRSDGLVRLRIGTQHAAQIQQQRVQPLHSSSPPADLEETPSKLHEDAQTFSEFGQAISMSLPRPAAEPVARSLGGRWSLYSLDPANAQARYRQQIEQARLEMQQRKSEKLRPRTENPGEELMTEQVDRASAKPVSVAILPSEVISQLDGLWELETTASKTTVGDVDPAVLADIRDTLTTDTSYEEVHENLFPDESATGDDEGSRLDEVDEMVLVPATERVHRRQLRRCE